MTVALKVRAVGRKFKKGDDSKASLKSQKSTKARTIESCLVLGWIAGDVERYNAFSKTTNDLFGFADIIAVDPARCGSVYIQVTTYDNMMARVNKIMEEVLEKATKVLQAQNSIEVWGWGDFSKRRDPRRKMDAKRIEIKMLSNGVVIYKKIQSYRELKTSLTFARGC